MLSRFADDVIRRSAVLLLDGPPGIGKSFQLERLVEQATARGVRILRAAPSESEVRLVGSALIDLCLDVSDAEIATLPGPLASALSAGLLRSHADADENVIPRAFASVLVELVKAGPLLVAVDDVQWLDRQTAEVLAFALRRLPSSSVGVVMTARSGQAEEFLAQLPRELVQRHTIAPLPDAELTAVVAAALGGPVSRGVLRRVVEVSGGNPLFAIAVARALVAAGGDGAKVPLPGSLTAVIGDRVRALPEDCRRALAAVAAVRRPTTAHLSRLGLLEALPPAERADVVRIEGDDLHFRHPLYAAAAYDELTASERLVLHQRLAEVVEGPEERSRHLALSASGPDAEVATALEVAAEHASSRGAVDAAIEAARLALRLTPPADTRAQGRRRLALAIFLARHNDAESAAVELERVIEATADPDVRGRALLELAKVDTYRIAPESARAVLDRALDTATDPALRAEIHLALADFAERKDEALAHAERAVALLTREADGSDLRLLRADSARAEAAFLTGKGLDLGAFQRVVTAESRVESPHQAWTVAGYLSVLVMSDELTLVDEVFDESVSAATRCGDDMALSYAYLWKSAAEVKRGRLDRCLDLADQMVRIGTRAGHVETIRSATYQRAVALATLGRFGEADHSLQEAVDHAVQAGADAAAHVGFLTGYVALLRGDWQTAAADMDRALGMTERMGVHDPGAVAGSEFQADALLGAGDFERAGEHLDVWHARAVATARPSALAWTARCRALWHCERGDQAEALSLAEHALAQHSDLGLPFARARVLLTKGQVHRRFRQKALAKACLEEARAEFERMGIAPYAERTRVELGRIGLRPPAPADLTETEKKVADLVAQGLNNAEVALALFISRRTVEANLARIYLKLGVRNRVELTTKLRT